MIQSSVSAKTLVVRIKYNLVLPKIRYTDAVVGKALSWMEVENEDQTSSIKHNDLVWFILRANITLENE